MQSMILTEEMREAIALLNEGKERLLWISGRAGTGKSTFLHYLKTEIRPERSVYLAPTAVAALTVGAQTIHSFFWIDPRREVQLETDLDPEREARLYPLLASLETLVIDEISMVRADLLDEIDRRMRRAKGEDLPFGGARLILFGDPYQLPPVEPEPGSPSAALFYRRYKSPFFFSALALRKRARQLRRIEFTRVFRQQEADFLATLDRCRAGEPTEEDLDLLGSRVLPEGKKAPADHLVIAARRDEVRRVNRYRLESLEGASRVYRARAEGRFAEAGEDEELPAPRELELKVGARVMCTVNDPRGRWSNGALATVAALGEDKVTLRDEAGEFELGPHEWRRTRYTLRGNAPAEEGGDAFAQLPLVPGWAVTVHRVQGRTLEKVFVDLSRGAFAAGQAYVAISRVTRLEGLLLRARPRARDFIAHQKVAAFLDYLEAAGG